MVAPTYITSIVVLLAQVLPLLGVQVESEALTTTITTVVTIVAAVYIGIRQLKTGRSTLFGTRP
jgi:uncharacterized membrane protein